ncbi:MAG: hypothetical protein MJA32_10865, partial [Proteobacteria bacterium]|nr:hypothetical protein [Pseudomonadota bacterium]
AVAGLLSARTVEDGESHAKYGELVILEEFLPGKEITLTVMPPGGYGLRGAEVSKSNYWAMPVVERFNHRDGIAPYSGVVAVTGNSALLRTGTECDDHLARLVRECERAAEFIRGKAAIRIDCRATAQGDFRLFDVNMKPNMTGPGRPGRDRQDSLSCIAARAIGWEYKDLIFNLLRQSWPSTSMERATDSGPDGTAARTTGGGRHDR